MMAPIRGVALLLALWLPAAVMAADAPSSPSRPVPPARNAGPFTPPSADCLEWTDGCRTCTRNPGGEAICSNIGIACVPTAPVCSKR